MDLGYVLKKRVAAVRPCAHHCSSLRPRAHQDRASHTTSESHSLGFGVRIQESALRDIATSPQMPFKKRLSRVPLRHRVYPRLVPLRDLPQRLVPLEGPSSRLVRDSAFLTPLAHQDQPLYNAHQDRA